VGVLGVGLLFVWRGGWLGGVLFWCLGSGCGVWGWGFTVQGAGFRVQQLGFGVRILKN